MKPNNFPTRRTRRRALGALGLLVAAGVVVSTLVVADGTPASASRVRYSSHRSTATTAARPATTTTVKPATTTTAKPVATTSPTTAPPKATSTTVTTAPKSTGAATTSSVMFGAETDTLSQLSAFEADAGKKASLYGYYASFYWDSDFNPSLATSISSRGTIPMLTWEPWEPNGNVNQPTYSLAQIANGSFDAYISRWANEIKSWNKPLWLRFAHEMNGDWYPWSEGVNGNTSGQYIAAWRHVHDVFAQAGVTNVKWIWTPNVLMDGRPSLASLYPGDAYVDWVGFDGYNWGTSASWSTWQSPTSVMGATLTALRQITSRPIVIGETGSSEIGGSKAQWIQQFFSMLSANPDVKAFLWFNLNKENDWRIESSAAAQAAFAAGVADSRFVSS